jgi:hypothetical protein
MSQRKIYLPPPSNWQDFQDLVVQIASMQYESSQDYGRIGQRQNGVDVYAETWDKKKIGIQCKETKGELNEKVVEKDAEDAKSFSQKLDLFIIATTDRRDARLQDWVIELNNSGRFPFGIRVDFWDDFQNYINQSAMVFNSCYEHYRTAFQQTDETHHLECIQTAFDRPAFKDDFLHERNYDSFGEALAETMRLFSIGVLRDRWSSVGIIQTVPLHALPTGKYKASIKKINDMVEKLYRDYIADARRFTSDHRYAQERAGHYNIERRKLLNTLNKMLSTARLLPVAFHY